MKIKNKLYHVSVKINIVVLAEDYNKAVDIARDEYMGSGADDYFSLEPFAFSATEIKTINDIPDSWKNFYPRINVNSDDRSKFTPVEFLEKDKIDNNINNIVWW